MMNNKLKKNLLIIVIILSLAVVIGIVIYYLSPKFFGKNENSEVDSYEEYVLKYDQGPIVGCIIGDKQGANSCYKIAEKTFSEGNFFNNSKEIKNLTSGIHILRLNKDKWEKYPVKKEELLEGWYENMLENEELFIAEVNGGIDVDLYNRVRFRRIQILKKDYTQEGLIEELSKYSQNPYRIFSPMRYSDLSYVCSLMSSESCDSWKVHQEIPYEFIKSINEDSSFDYSDLRNLFSRIKFLNMGYDSIDTLDEASKIKIEEYDNFFSSVISNYPHFSKEKILFISNYLPFYFVEQIDPLYEYWEGEFANNYLWLIGASCNNNSCLDIKLNILYDEYTK